jgi:hypothetical protein
MRSITFRDEVLHWIASLLASEDREAVLGDLAEEGVGLVRSVMSISNLVVRREFAEWCAFTPWAVLLLVLLPSCVLLAVVSHSLIDASAIPVWFFANNWDGYLLRQPAFWRGLCDSLPGLLISA